MNIYVDANPLNPRAVDCARIIRALAAGSAVPTHGAPHPTRIVSQI